MTKIPVRLLGESPFFDFMDSKFIILHGLVNDCFNASHNLTQMKIDTRDR